MLCTSSPTAYRLLVHVETSSYVCFLSKDAVSLAKSSLWAPGGTGSRIFGDNLANKAGAEKGKEGTGAESTKNAQDRLASMQKKLQNKNLSNKKRQELKKQEMKMRNNAKKRSSGNVDQRSHDDAELVVANVQALTI